MLTFLLLTLTYLLFTCMDERTLEEIKFLNKKKTKTESLPPCYCYHKGYIACCRFVRILCWCSFIILVLMVIDLPLQLVFLLKVEMKWEGGGRVSRRAPSTWVTYSHSVRTVRVIPAQVAGQRAYATWLVLESSETEILVWVLLCWILDSSSTQSPLDYHHVSFES